jgi:hypothetical protein
MAHVRVTHSFDMGAVRVMQQNPAGGVARDMYRRGQNVRAEAQRLAGWDTGRLRATIHVEHVERDGVVGAAGSGRTSSTPPLITRATERWFPAGRAGSWCSGPGAGRWSSRSACDRSRSRVPAQGAASGAGLAASRAGGGVLANIPCATRRTRAPAP